MASKNLNTTNWGVRLVALGYDLTDTAKDMDDRIHRYRTSGQNGGAVLPSGRFPGTTSKGDCYDLRG